MKAHSYTSRLVFYLSVCLSVKSIITTTTIIIYERNNSQSSSFSHLISITTNECLYGEYYFGKLSHKSSSISANEVWPKNNSLK